MTDTTDGDIQAAARVGNHAATTDAHLATHGDAIKDELHHLGDDRGRIITRAYRSNGPVGAADVRGILPQYQGSTVPNVQDWSIRAERWASRSAGRTLGRLRADTVLPKDR